jgi:hypothetical protein
MAVVYVSNLIIYTGTDFDQTFVLEDSQSNSVMNLTGYNGCAQIKRYETSTASASFDVSFANDRTTGRVTISMSSATTASIKPGKYFYDILLNSRQGITKRVVEGQVLVKQSVTR